MVSILPSARSTFDVVGELLGQNLQQTFPGAVQQGYQRQLGLSALDQAQQDIAQAGGDPFKIALAFAKAGAQNPNLERSLGPLYQTALQQSRVKGAFGQPQQQQQQQQPLAASVTSPVEAQSQTQVSPQNQFVENAALQAHAPSATTPGPFNIFTPSFIDEESTRYAQVMNDPDAKQARITQLQALNDIATAQRQALEDVAIKSGVKPEDLPLFMQVGSKFDPSNPSKWSVEAKRAWLAAKDNMDKLKKTFIPGIGSGLLGRNRQEYLKNMEPTVQDLVKAGLEQETRVNLAKNFVTPTEREQLIHPLTPQNDKSISALPRGTFPFQEPVSFKSGIPVIPESSPFISFEEAKEKAPKELQTMQNFLSDFFLKNVDKDTSLLALRDKIIRDRDYDWRQIGPAIRQAMNNGLQLEPFQSTEMAELETQAPYDSLPHIFQSWDRFKTYLRGSR